MKRNNLLFVIGVCTFLCIVFMLKQLGPRTYDWRITFDPSSDEPFGTTLFDSLMQETLPQGYRLRRESVTEFSRRDTVQPHNVLVISNDYRLSSEDEEFLLQMVEQGARVMFVNASQVSFEESLGLESFGYWDNFDYQDVKKQIARQGVPDYDTLQLCGTEDYPPQQVRVLKNLVNHRYLNLDSVQVYATILMTEGARPITESYNLSYDVSVVYEERLRPVAVRFDIGEGQLYLVTPSLLFTNYGMLDPQCRMVVMRLMNELKDRPVVRLYEDKDNQDGSTYGALDFFARHAPLRLAWYLAFAGAVLGLVVNARRRQRAIPVRRRRKNATIDFLVQYASLYRKRTDHAPLLQKKYQAFAADMQRLWRIDVMEIRPAVRREQAERLAQYLQVDSFSVMADLEELDRLRTTGAQVTPQLFAQAMRLMQRLTPR